jgi:hypothetical protein
MAFHVRDEDPASAVAELNPADAARAPPRRSRFQNIDVERVTLVERVRV